MPTDFYDAAWAAVPEGSEPEAFALRLQFLLAALAPGDRVLDVGCGDGAFAAEMRRAGADPVGVEVAPEALRRARIAHPGLDLHLVSPGGPLPFEDASFDVVWAGEVIEHVVDVARLLSEARRVLKPAGRLLVTTPHQSRLSLLRLAFSPRGFASHFDPRSPHVRFLSRRSLSELLTDLGYDEIEVRTAGGLPLMRPTLLASAVRPALLSTR